MIRPISPVPIFWSPPAPVTCTRTCTRLLQADKAKEVASILTTSEVKTSQSPSIWRSAKYPTITDKLHRPSPTHGLHLDRHLDLTQTAVRHLSVQTAILGNFLVAGDGDHPVEKALEDTTLPDMAAEVGTNRTCHTPTSPLSRASRCWPRPPPVSLWPRWSSSLARLVDCPGHSR